MSYWTGYYLQLFSLHTHTHTGSYFTLAFDDSVWEGVTIYTPMNSSYWFILMVAFDDFELEGTTTDAIWMDSGRSTSWFCCNSYHDLLFLYIIGVVHFLVSWSSRSGVVVSHIHNSLVGMTGWMMSWAHRQ